MMQGTLSAWILHPLSHTSEHASVVVVFMHVCVDPRYLCPPDRCPLVLTCNPAARVTVYLDSGLCSDTP